MRTRTPCQNTAAPKTQTTSPTTPHFQRFSPKWSAIWAPHRLKSRPRRHQSGELHYTSLRHAARRLRVVQTPATVGVEGADRTRGLRCQAAAPVGDGRAWPDNAPTRRAKLAARTPRGRAAAHGRTKQHGPEQQREGRCTRYGAQHPIRRGALPTDRVQRPESQEQTRNLRDDGRHNSARAHPLWAAAPVMGRDTRYGPLHPIRRGALPTDRVERTQSQEQTRNLRDNSRHAQDQATGARSV